MKQKKYIPTNDNIKIAIIGLGYVGLPLFCQLSKLYSCIGYDVDYNRINELSNGIDSRNNVKTEKICDAISYSIVTTDIRKIATCNILIVTVPTPINNYFLPDTSALENACLSISKILRPKTIVVFESTVYPGATEELCVPLLSKNSRLVFNKDFFVGYSPERINIGDDKHQISNVPKIISGSTPDVTNFLASIYQSVLEQPVVIASSIKVAEAAKMANGLQLTNSDGSTSKTTKRVEEAYSEERFNELYTYYCCYSHFNVAATIWTATRKHLGGDTVVKHSLYIFSFYADIFSKLIQAIGSIIDDDDLRKYNRDKVDKAVKWLIDSNTNNLNK